VLRKNRSYPCVYRVKGPRSECEMTVGDQPSSDGGSKEKEKTDTGKALVTSG